MSRGFLKKIKKSENLCRFLPNPHLLPANPRHHAARDGQKCSFARNNSREIPPKMCRGCRIAQTARPLHRPPMISAQPRLRTTRRDSGGGKFFPARYFPGPGAHADTQARAARAVRLHLWCKPCAGWSGMPTGKRSFCPFWRVRCPTQNKRRNLFRTSPLIQSKTVPGHSIRTRLAQKSAGGPTESRRPSARPRASAHRP